MPLLIKAAHLDDDSSYAEGPESQHEQATYFDYLDTPPDDLPPDDAVWGDERIIGQSDTGQGGAELVALTPSAPPPSTSQDILSALDDDNSPALNLNFWTVDYVRDYVVANPQVWIAHRLLEAGTVNTLVAEPKAGKSTMLRTLVYKVATGGEFLGRKCIQGPVLYYALEDKVHSFDQFMEANGRPDVPIILVPHFPEGDFRSDLALKHLAAGIRRFNPVLVVIDMAINFMRIEDTNDYTDSGEFFLKIKPYVKERKCAVVVSIHANKSDPDKIGATNPNRALGSTAFQGMPATQIIYWNNPKTRIRHVGTSQRTGDFIEESRVHFDRDGNQHVELMADDNEWAEAHKDEKAKLKHLLLTMHGLQLAGELPCTIPALMEACNVDRSNYNHVWKNAVRDGWLGKTGSGRKGSPFMLSLQREIPQEWLEGRDIRVSADVIEASALPPGVSRATKSRLSEALSRRGSRGADNPKSEPQHETPD